MRIFIYASNRIIFEDDSDNMKDCVEGAIKKGVSLVHADFTNADLEGANLSNYSFATSIFRNAKLNGANLSNSNFASCNFFLAEMKEVNARGAVFENAIFGGIDLSGSNFEHANLYGCTLNQANLEGVNFTDANVVAALLKFTNLKDADFTRANLRASGLNGANLEGAALIDANLQNTSLLDIRLDNLDLSVFKGVKNLHKAKLDHSFVVWYGQEFEKKFPTQKTASARGGSYTLNDVDRLLRLAVDANTIPQDRIEDADAVYGQKWKRDLADVLNLKKPSPAYLTKILKNLVGYFEEEQPPEIEEFIERIYNLSISKPGQKIANRIVSNPPSKLSTVRMIEGKGYYLVASDDYDIHAFDSRNGEAVGYVLFQKKGKNLIAFKVAVVPKHQSKGIAVAMYDYAREQYGLLPAPSKTLLEEGAAFWEGYRKKSAYR